MSPKAVNSQAGDSRHEKSSEVQPVNAADARHQQMFDILDNFPEELIARDQWVLWRYAERNGKKTKVPFQPNNRPAESTQPQTWSSCQQVMLAFADNPAFDGVGFVFSADDPYIGIDLDKCRDTATGEVEAWAQEIIDEVQTYVELSPSGEGFHIIGKAKLPPKGRRKDRLEMYDAGRYFTVTGDRCSTPGMEANDIHEAVQRLHSRVFGGAKADHGKRSPRAANDPIAAEQVAHVPLEDSAVIESILRSSDATDFNNFQSGNWGAMNYPSQSEGDLALAGMLVRHGARSLEQLDRIFRSTGMVRDKWDQLRGSNTYGEMTIAKALEGAGQADSSSALIEALNRQYAVVQHGGKVRVLNEGLDGSEFNLLSVQDFGVLTATLPKIGTKTAANAWISSPARRCYGGVVFSPGRPVEGKYNLWRGFSVEPQAGDCALYKQLVREAICAGSAAVFAYVWNYLAHLIQRPWELPEVALVLRGGQGTGKNTFVDSVGALVSHHYCQINNVDQLTGRFNAHMRNVVLLHANEATWGGNKAEAGKLKSIITDSKLPVEMKNQDIFEIDNVIRLIVSSNESWPVPIDADDRRFLVLDVSNKFKQDQKFFGTLRTQLGSGGLQALMHELLTTDISAFSPRAKPATSFGADMKIRSADGPTRWTFEVLNTGNLTRNAYEQLFGPRGIGTPVLKRTLYDDYVNWCKATQDHYPVQQSQFHKRLSDLLGQTMVTKRPAAKPQAGRERQVVMTSMRACRQAFERSAGVAGTVKWDPV